MTEAELKAAARERISGTWEPTSFSLKADEDSDSEGSVGEYVLELLARIEALEQKQPLHGWQFKVVRDEKGLIDQVLATPVLQ